MESFVDQLNAPSLANYRYRFSNGCILIFDALFFFLVPPFLVDEIEARVVHAWIRNLGILKSVFYQENVDQFSTLFFKFCSGVKCVCLVDDMRQRHLLSACGSEFRILESLL